MRLAIAQKRLTADGHPHRLATVMSREPRAGQAGQSNCRVAQDGAGASRSVICPGHSLCIQSIRRFSSPQACKKFGNTKQSWLAGRAVDNQS